jgi:hypothetical protein
VIRRGAELWTVDTGANALKHLTRIDASFLYFETPETPMHVGSLMLLEFPAGFAAYVKAHPSGIDGKVGIELSKIVDDISPRAREVPPPRQRPPFAAGQAVGIAELRELPGYMGDTLDEIRAFQSIEEPEPAAAPPYKPIVRIRARKAAVPIVAAAAAPSKRKQAARRRS